MTLNRLPQGEQDPKAQFMPTRASPRCRNPRSPEHLLTSTAPSRAFNTSLVTQDKRFEVDGAFAARNFVSQSRSNEKWPRPRLQLIWDAIALHTTPDIAAFKEPEVALVSAGTLTELVGPALAAEQFGSLITVTQDEWDAIASEFPRPGLRGYLRGVMVGLCRMKPETTYRNFVGDYGEVFLGGEGYTRVGHREVDLLEKTLPE